MVLTGSRNAAGTVAIPRRYLGGFDRISIRTVQVPDAGKRCTADDLLIQISDSDPPEVQFKRGDGDASGKLDISDPINTLGYLFLGSAPPKCHDAADADDSGKLDISDAIYSLTFLFLGGPAPESPYPDCGTDPIGDPPDPLDCAEYSACLPP